MSSPRAAPKPLNLDAATFGDTPAARYLVEALNLEGDVSLARKVSRILSENRELLGDLARAHLDYDALSTKSLARLLPILSSHFKAAPAESLSGANPLIGTLVNNVLEGGLKVWKSRVQAARRQERTVSKRLGPEAVQGWLPAYPLENEKTAASLKEKSKLFLAKKGKRDTLY